MPINPRAVPPCFGDEKFRVGTSAFARCQACFAFNECSRDGGKSLSPAYIAKNYGGVHPLGTGAAPGGLQAAGAATPQWEGFYGELLQWASPNPELAQYIAGLRQKWGL